jgi:hypothetical protein
MFTSRRSTTYVSSFQLELFEPSPTPGQAISDAGRGLIASVASWFERTIAAEHFCDPPEDLGRFWAIERAGHVPAAHDKHYCCPECRERWVGASH